MILQLWIVTQPRKPARFIVWREAEHRQDIVLHAVNKMVDAFVSRTTAFTVQAGEANHQMVLW